MREREWDRKQLEKLELERLRQLEQKRALEIQQLQQQKKPSSHKKHRSERESTIRSSRKGRINKSKDDEKHGHRNDRNREHCDDRDRESKHCKDLRLNTTLNIRKLCTGKIEPIYNSHGKLIKFIVIDISYYKHPTHRDEILAATVSPGSTVIVNISDAYLVFYQCCSCSSDNRDGGIGGLSSVGYPRIRSL